MAELTTTELAARLGLSKGRISQYVSEGKLAGCYRGDGRSRRFDLVAATEALGRGLDLGQMTGNGLNTRRALREIEAAQNVGAPADPAPAPASAPCSVEAVRPEPRPAAVPLTLTPAEPDRLEMATILAKEEQARKLRRDNERDEGNWVLASEVRQNVARAMAQELAEFESVIRDTARAIADVYGLDFREVRKVMMDRWRKHRQNRMSQAQTVAGTAAMSEAETEANV
ncbi:MerR family transcriptional regulator [Paenirhodobacter enshiensis]|uniref:Helix-turn-helix domain-containing protein n=1 Tax=Paenirhodobacter enshiensis TaxID=1105367 RepID=A0A086XQQ9_9RHOB|nr:hypothetical protein [Paenirhodobacter enshiensis]KFI24359.1 hypothetical protein CG50_10690 [Paenirhodobacter enshiensis]